MNPPITNYSQRVKFNGHYEAFYLVKNHPIKDLKIPGKHVAQSKLIQDKDGYICVATNLVEMVKKINTSLGMGKRYDTCHEPNIVYMYIDK